MEPIYLDYCATTPIDPRVVAAMNRVWESDGGNPSSLHRAGRQARCMLEDAADEMLRTLGGVVDSSRSDRFILTSGGTEANNLALLGLPARRPGRIVISSIEHPSTMAAADQLRRQGWTVDSIRVDASGRIDLDHCAQLVGRGEKRPELVSVMLANHETGVVQPVREVVGICEPVEVPVHTDAVQAIGCRPVRIDELGVTMMTIAAHKFHGPVGIGALLVRDPARVEPILFGGAQQLGARPGTEGVALTVGMQQALRLVQQEQPDRVARMEQLRDGLQSRLFGLPDVAINGTGERLPHVLNISFLGADRQALLIALDLAGVYCSAGPACASGSTDPSPVLQAMGLADERVASALRLSVGYRTTPTDVDRAVERILKAVNQLRS